MELYLPWLLLSLDFRGHIIITCVARLCCRCFKADSWHRVLLTSSLGKRLPDVRQTVQCSELAGCQSPIKEGKLWGSHSLLLFCHQYYIPDRCLSGIQMNHRTQIFPLQKHLMHWESRPDAFLLCFVARAIVVWNLNVHSEIFFHYIYPWFKFTL